MMPFEGPEEPVSRRARRLVLIIDADPAVFITGESGTGKELAAEAVHKASPPRSAASPSSR
jgi:two-component system, repressor protein LuxO